VMICRSQKPEERKNKTLLIHAVKEVHKERSQSFLKPEHQSHILKAYQDFREEPGFTAVVDREQLLTNGGRLSIPLYVKGAPNSDEDGEIVSLDDAWNAFESDGERFWGQMTELVEMLDTVSGEEASND